MKIEETIVKRIQKTCQDLGIIRKEFVWKFHNYYFELSYDLQNSSIVLKKSKSVNFNDPHDTQLLIRIMKGKFDGVCVIKTLFEEDPQTAIQITKDILDMIERVVTTYQQEYDKILKFLLTHPEFENTVEKLIIERLKE